MSASLIGFVLLFSSCGRDVCEWTPVTEKIYPALETCRQVAGELKKRRPHYEFSCGEVYRGEKHRDTDEK
ncbi:hypothetical protein SMZ59_003120 [Salmonella enterica]|nr:hypothetical protein [Salmonella enterica subsp. enterica serovar Muenchen]EHC5871357.1 hypothetical protein [Salmonella enterica subsp. enterica serovar Eastbourne]EKC2494563.1 hypothetical protein [Salmonella enterica]EHC5907251.1 hypothetical protein [Salmonella enterica subsp. enterica serovar Eastbourne]EKL5246289.1 hypothetical protein [Salmonella enterica]